LSPDVAEAAIVRAFSDKLSHNPVNAPPGE
jgi:hypothetical protein